MKSERELNEDILDIKSKITKEYPELVKFVEEIPVKMQYQPGQKINLKQLQDYYNSLQEIIKKYESEGKKQ